MPHLRFEYSAGLEVRLDMGRFAEAMRDAMAATGVFPIGGVRVRGHRADVSVVAGFGADDPAAGFIDMSLRMGAGRDNATKARVAEAIYGAAEAHLRPILDPAPFALSLEVREIDPALSLKRYNTLHQTQHQSGERQITGASK